MLSVVSPAKNLDYETPATTTEFSQPSLLDHASELVDVCKTLSPADLSSLMGISDKLAGLNAARFGQWSQPFNTENAKQAILAFNGDVYVGLDAPTFSEADFNYAQEHFRILSGLYGLLRPLDLMQPYRLEMGTKLENSRGANLYQFWGSVITEALNKQLEQLGEDTLINLASNEYFKSVKKRELNGTIITPVFKDQKNGQYKVISFFAKKARGLMARYLIQNQVKDLDGLLKFDLGGYSYDESLSKADAPVFTRPEQ